MVGKFYAIKDEKSINTGTGDLYVVYDRDSFEDVTSSEDSEDCLMHRNYMMRRAILIPDGIIPHMLSTDGDSIGVLVGAVYRLPCQPWLRWY